MDPQPGATEVSMVKTGQKLCANGFHSWHRDLQTIDGEECVVRTCRQCGTTEVCWSPHKRPLEEEESALPPWDRLR
jgi:hypothetical protein